MNKNYIVSYVLDSDNTGINIITFIANPAFDEVGQYTSDEAEKVVDFLRKQKVPEFKDEYKWGGKTYKEWDEFVKKNKIKIKELLK
jgi:hypothetical protein